jgi:hypothetical protein
VFVDEKSDIVLIFILTSAKWVSIDQVTYSPENIDLNLGDEPQTVQTEYISKNQPMNIMSKAQYIAPSVFVCDKSELNSGYITDLKPVKLKQATP